MAPAPMFADEEDGDGVEEEAGVVVVEGDAVTVDEVEDEDCVGVPVEAATMEELKADIPLGERTESE